jgi:hypothetical protein
MCKNCLYEEWISVKDALPHEKITIDGESYFKHVLIYTDNVGYPCRIAYFDDETNEWYCVGDFFPMDEDETVTHWAPLPEPPKSVNH